MNKLEQAILVSDEERTVMIKFENDKDGFYGQYGGNFAPEILIPTLEQLNDVFQTLSDDEGFRHEFIDELKNIGGINTPLTPCPNLQRHFKYPAEILVKREDLNHSGAHKIKNVVGQGLLVKRMGKTRVIAETGAGQHGVATAMMAARFGLECTIYMGAKDVKRQYPNVFWMQKFGATVVPVETGSQTLKDAMDAAFRDWSGSFENTHYIIGTSCGSAPYPQMVAWFQSIIGEEIKSQCMDDVQQLPAKIFACVGGGSNAAGAFGAFIGEKSVELIGIEAAGKGYSSSQHSIRFNHPGARPGVAQGYCTEFIQDEDGQLGETHSVAAGLDYVGVSPLLAHWFQRKQITMKHADDQRVVEALELCMRLEGLVPALESAHAFAGAFEYLSSRTFANTEQFRPIVIVQSGRGDKDIFTQAAAFDQLGTGQTEFKQYLSDYLNDYGEVI
ncbi:MAG: tryptophan synthase beta chain [Gammaproteobacteria bacterium]|jgi:tryptophan synthase beta chain